MKKENKEFIEVKTDSGVIIVLDKKELMQCDGCGEKSLRAKELFEGGGVTCIKKECDYWFCF